MNLQRNDGCRHLPSNPGEREPLLSPDQIAKWLGVSKSTVYHLVEGEGPNRLKFGNNIRYRQCCVVAWLAEHLEIRSQASGA